MYNFKNIGCTIDIDSLQLKQLICKEKEEIEKKRRNDMDNFKRIKKEKKKYHTVERKYDEIISLNFPDDYGID